jgi:MFS family permease
MNQSQGTAALAPATAGAARGRAGAPALDLPEDPLSRRARRPRVTGTPALLLLASLVVSMLAGSSAPTPLYGIYQRQWGFTPITTTIIFAVYAVTVLVALLAAGRLSDYAGRRPVLLAALAVQVVALLVYARADGVGLLMAARVIQGLSTGVAFGTVSAALLDVSRERGALANALAAGLGTGGGALLSALFVQFLPAPTRLIYLALAGVVVLQAVGVALLRETVTRRRIPASALVPDVRLPPATRGPVLAAAPVLFAVWAMFGLYGALGPSLVQALAGSSSVVLGGAALATLGAGMVVSVYLLRNAPARVVMLAGIGALVGGVAITLIALGTGSAALFFVGTAVSGIGFGGGFQGGIRTVVPFAAPQERAGVMSLLFVVSYLGMGVPTVIAGFLVVHGAGLIGAARYYDVALIVLAAAALAALFRSARPARR